MFAFVRDLLARTRASGKSAAKRRPGISLQLEALEDRLTPSAYTIPVGGIGSGGAAGNPGLYKPFVVSGNTLNVYGTSGNDNFDFTAGASGNTVKLNNASFNVNPSQIHNINFYGNGGTDHASLTDTLNQANVTLHPHYGTMSGSNYLVSLNNTTSILASGRSGDTANFYDSSGNDTFVAGGRSAGMYDSNSTYLNYATGFSYNKGYSSNGGTDVAQFFDTAGNDTYFAGMSYAGMFDSANTYSNYATGFASTHGYSSSGGTDTAYLFDSAANGISSGGTLLVNQTEARLLGYHYDNTATGFSDVEAYSAGIEDYYQFDATPNYTLHMHGNWEQQ